MRLRKLTALIGGLAIAAVIAVVFVALYSRPTQAVPTVRLLHLRRTVSNPVAADSASGDWLPGGAPEDSHETWNAEFELRTTLESGIQLSHEKVGVSCQDSTGGWTDAVLNGPNPNLKDLGFVFPESFRTVVRSVRVSVPSGTERCKLSIGIRTRTARERSREYLAEKRVWNRLPSGIKWLVEQLPDTKHWTEWNTEVALHQILIEDAQPKLSGPPAVIGP
jgi:hypothetical protein